MSTNMLPIANPKKENAVRVNMTYRFERGSISNIFMPTIQAMIASIEKKINLRILILTLMLRRDGSLPHRAPFNSVDHVQISFGACEDSICARPATLIIFKLSRYANSRLGHGVFPA